MPAPTRIVLTLASLALALLIPALILSSCGSKGCDPSEDLSSQVVVESAELVSGDSCCCRIVGTVFNNSDKRAYGTLIFRAFETDGRRTQDAFADLFGSSIPPHSSARYSSSHILRIGGGFPSCSEIARFELAKLMATDSNCTTLGGLP
jgi:hypothetical protein